MAASDIRKILFGCGCYKFCLKTGNNRVKHGVNKFLEADTPMVCNSIFSYAKTGFVEPLDNGIRLVLPECKGCYIFDFHVSNYWLSIYL